MSNAIQITSLKYQQSLIAHMMNSPDNVLKVLEAGITQHFFPALDNDDFDNLFYALVVCATQHGEVSFPLLLKEMTAENASTNPTSLLDAMGYDAEMTLDNCVKGVIDMYQRRQMSEAIESTKSRLLDMGRPAVEHIGDLSTELTNILTSVGTGSKAGPLTAAEMYASLERPDAGGVEIGVGFKFDKKMWRAKKGDLVLVTGHPNGGKSQFASACLGLLAKNHKWRTLVWSAEHSREDAGWKMVRPVAGIPIYNGKFESPEHRENMDKWLAWHETYFRYFHNAAEFNHLNAILAAAQIIHKQWPFDCLYIDPWTDLYVDVRNQREDQWIGNALTDVKAFCHRLDVMALIVAHPTKGIPANVTPTLQDIAGSRHFNAKADVGITFHSLYNAGLSDDRNENEVTTTKIRNQNGGKMTLPIRWNPQTWEFTEQATM